jgi:hypothetical protein
MFTNTLGVAGWKGPYSDPTSCFDEWGTPVRYVYDSTHIEIRSAGPDHKFDTHDDIVLDGADIIAFWRISEESRKWLLEQAVKKEKSKQPPERDSVPAAHE